MQRSQAVCVSVQDIMLHALILSLVNQCLSWVDTVRYLGIYFVSSRKLKCSLDHAKRSFYRSVNAVFGKVGRLVPEDVVLHLVDSKCMPIPQYVVKFCPLSQSDIRSIDFVLVCFHMKLFKTNNEDNINDCCTSFSFKLPSERVQDQKMKFNCIFCNVQNYSDMLLI